MIKFTESRIDGYAWMKMGGDSFDARLGDITKRVQECQESIPKYEESLKKKIKRLFDDTEAIDKEYTYDPAKQDKNVVMQPDQIQEYKDQMNKILLKYNEKNNKKNGKGDQRPKKMK